MTSQTNDLTKSLKNVTAWNSREEMVETLKRGFVPTLRLKDVKGNTGRPTRLYNMDIQAVRLAVEEAGFKWFAG